MFIFMIHVADAVWVALHVWALERPKPERSQKKKREKGTRKQNDERMNVAKFQAYYCSHFCLYFALGNSKGCSYSVRNVAALH